MLLNQKMQVLVVLVPFLMKASLLLETQEWTGTLVYVCSSWPLTKEGKKEEERIRREEREREKKKRTKLKIVNIILVESYYFIISLSVVVASPKLNKNITAKQRNTPIREQHKISF